VAAIVVQDLLVSLMLVIAALCRNPAT